MSTGWTISPKFRDTLTPTTVIDVGVSKGTQPLYDAFPDAYYLLVEPLAENERHMKRILRKLRGEYVLGAAGSAAGTATLNVEPNRNGMSSLLHRTDLTSTGDRLETREVPIATVDTLVTDRKLAGPYGLKIDTEGYELEVLRGARGLLTECEFVLTEVSTAERFKTGYTSSDVITELANHGFAVADVLGSTKTYVDLLFTRQ